MDNNSGRQWLNVVSLLFSSIAIVLSIITVCSLEDHSFCSDSALISIMGIIVAAAFGAVTILITWQIFKYFSLKQEMQKVADEAIDKIVDSLSIYNKAISEVDNDITLVCMDRKPCEQIKWHMKALKTALSCEHVNLRNNAIKNIMDRLDSSSSLTKLPHDKWRIPKGRKDEYLLIAQQIVHNNSDDLIDYVANAKEE